MWSIFLPPPIWCEEDFPDERYQVRNISIPKLMRCSYCLLSYLFRNLQWTLLRCRPSKIWSCDRSSVPCYSFLQLEISSGGKVSSVVYPPVEFSLLVYCEEDLFPYDILRPYFVQQVSRLGNSSASLSPISPTCSVSIDSDRLKYESKKDKHI